MYRTPLLALLALLIASPISQSHSQFFKDTNFIPKLTIQDKLLANKAARENLTGKRAGTVASWKNDKSGNSGIAYLVKNYSLQSNSCREVVHTYNFKEEKRQRWRFMLCKMTDGSWKWPEPPKRLE